MSGKKEVDKLDALYQAKGMVVLALNRMLGLKRYERSLVHCYRDRRGENYLYLKPLYKDFDLLYKYVRLRITGKPLTEKKSRVGVEVSCGVYHVFDMISRPLVSEHVSGYVDIETEEGVPEIVSDAEAVVDRFEEKIKDPVAVKRLLYTLTPYPRKELPYAMVYAVG